MGELTYLLQTRHPFFLWPSNLVVMARVAFGPSSVWILGDVNHQSKPLQESHENKDPPEPTGRIEAQVAIPGRCSWTATSP